MSNSRIENTKKNISSGVINKLSSMLLQFVNRTAIIYILGIQYAGLSGLFSSILDVLAIAELGFNSAIVFSLYKPMAEKDEKKICRLVSVIRRVYNIIGTCILIVGLIILPFLKCFIHGEYPNSINIYILYLISLLNSVISYFLFAYKECLLIADQKQNISNNIRTFVNIVRYVTQLIVLLFFQNYYIYLILAIIFTIITNVLIQAQTKRLYPYFRIDYSLKKVPVEIVKYVKGIMVNKICDTFRNSFDNIIISSFLGLTLSSVYGNYYYVFSAIYQIMLVLSSAM